MSPNRVSMDLVGSFSELILSSRETDTVPRSCMSSYTSACEEDPELQSFDSSLQQRLTKLINSLASRVGRSGFVSLDSLMEVCGFLVELSQDVVTKIIIASADDVSKNQELKSLVDLYFESTKKTLNLFNAVEKCVEKAKFIQLLIRVAIKQFETESLDTGFGGNKKNMYTATLEKLNKVKATEDPFGDEFMKQFKSVYAEQVEILNKIRELQVIFEKKHKNVKIWRRLGNLFFGTVFFAIIALSCVISFPVAVVGGVVATTVAGTGIWVNGVLKEKEKVMETGKDLLQLLENGTKVNTEGMYTIKELVDMLILRFSSILKTAEVAVEQREEETTKLVMQDIIKKVERFAEKIEEVGTTVSECSKSVVSGRLLVLKHIANSASLKGKKLD